MRHTQFSDYKGSQGKTMKQGSETIPDQNMGIRELLDRHSRGVPSGVNSKKGEYFDTEIVRYEDLTDMIEHKKQLNKQKSELMQKIKAAQALEKEHNAKIKLNTQALMNIYLET